MVQKVPAGWDLGKLRFRHDGGHRDERDGLVETFGAFFTFRTGADAERGGDAGDGLSERSGGGEERNGNVERVFHMGSFLSG